MGTGGFVIVDSCGREIVRAGRWFGRGLTNNEAEALACREALTCLASLARARPELRLPARVFGDSQLMIRFLTGIFKKPGKASIYEALQEARRRARELPHIAYRHVKRAANMVADDMARRALDAGADVTYWAGELPDGCPANQVEDVYEQQHDVAKQLPATATWDPPAISSCTCSPVLARVAAQQRCRDFADSLGLSADEREDAAGAAVGGWRWHEREVGLSAVWARPPEPPKPCGHCGCTEDQQSHVLCDRCNVGFCPRCRPQVGGSMIHDGPWFCGQCKGWLALHGPPDPTLDFALIDHLWAGYEPEDLDELARVQRLAGVYRSHGKELQV